MKNIKIFLILIILIFFLSGCSNNKENKKNEKINEEINYMDNKILSMLNELNNISLENYNIVYNEVELSEKSTDSTTGQKNEEEGEGESQGKNKGGIESRQSNQVNTTELVNESVLETDSNDIDWKLIKQEVETLNTSWTTILLDLYDVNIENTQIVGFSNTLNKTIISIENEEKNETLENLKELYRYIPIFIEKINANQSEKELKKAKTYLVNAYVLASKEEWENINEEIGKCETSFSKIISNMEYIENKEYKANKIYILIKECENSVLNKNQKLFYLKYKNLLQSINSI